MPPQYRLSERHALMTPSLAYILGVLLSDGSISKSYIKLDTIDREFRDAFASAIVEHFGITPSVYPVGRTLAGNTIYRCIVGSIEISKVLRRLTENTENLKSIGEDVLPFLVRGLWDGDGCIFQQNGCMSFRVRFSVKRLDIADLYAASILRIFGLECPVLGPDSKGMYTVAFGHLKDVVNFYTRVGSTVRRKTHLFEAAARHYESGDYRRRQDWGSEKEIEEARRLRELGLSSREIGLVLGYAHSTILRWTG